jgi:hypothetical protein
LLGRVSATTSLTGGGAKSVEQQERYPVLLFKQVREYHQANTP